ncbi:hypothetical protein HPB50_021212 [Hyalomma asiaticum]|uniref:Uncharacterized protein n=1 Tax=Hyalomma asiaticum TaxID=266040 RepID=A0ACB7RY04_HYAAI|nr:hypothetical protein HPB50_021212 [Hyalomma asiaticum]
MRGDELNLNYAEGTAHFIDLILKWWHVVNVKSPSKGRRLRDPLQDPVRSLTGKQIEFLNNFLDWLDTWPDIKMDTDALSTETHSALRLTCYALVELCRYCLEELNFDYVLLGKFQTDSLEERFGQYRRLSGTNYHISIQQVFESEKKLRLQDSLRVFVPVDCPLPTCRSVDGLVKRWRLVVGGALLLCPGLPRRPESRLFQSPERCWRDVLLAPSPTRQCQLTVHGKSSSPQIARPNPPNG